jgi:hypothetical protein
MPGGDPSDWTGMALGHTTAVVSVVGWLVVHMRTSNLCSRYKNVVAIAFLVSLRG